MGSFIPIEPSAAPQQPNTSPFTGIANYIMEKRQKEQEMEQARAMMLLKQQMAQSDMAKQQAYLSIAQQNQARAQQTQGAEDIEKIRGYAATDPGFAAQYGQMLGYKQQQAPQPDAVDEVLAAPSTTQRGSPSLGDLGGTPSDLTDDYGNKMQQSTPDMPMPDRSQSAVQSQNKIMAALQASKRLQFAGPNGNTFEIDPEAAKAERTAKYQEQVGLRTAGDEEKAQLQRDLQEERLTAAAAQAEENRRVQMYGIDARRKTAGAGGGRARPGAAGQVSDVIMKGGSAGDAYRLGEQLGMSSKDIERVVSVAGVDVTRKSTIEKRDKDKGKALGEIEGDLSATRDLASIIERNPKAFQAAQEAIISYRQLEKHPPIGRATAQYFGMARKSAEEELKDPIEREIFGRLMQQETRTAKNYGGVITESDIARAQAEQSLTGASPEQFAAALHRQAKYQGIKLTELGGDGSDAAAQRATGVAASAGRSFAPKANPIARASKQSLAREALNDPEATAEEKAAARRILGGR